MPIVNSVIQDIVPSKIRSFDNYISKDPQMIKLTVGEPDFDVPQHIKLAAIQAINNNNSHYTYFWGISKLRQAVVDYYANKFNIPVYSKEQVLCTVGATEALAATFKALFNPGDAIIIPQPAYPLYESLAKINQLIPVKIDTEADNFILTAAKLNQVIQDNPNLNFRGIVVNDPNNPTGVVYTQKQLLDLASILKKNDFWVISDEIYAELVFDTQHYSLSQLIPEQTVIINGLSKSHAMTGWRIGFIIGPEKVMPSIAKVHQALVTSPTSIVQYAALEALQNGTQDAKIMTSDYKKRSSFVTHSLQKMGFVMTNPQGTFYVFAKIPKAVAKSGSDFAKNLAQFAHVGVIPGSAFGNDHYIRISCATNYQMLVISMKRIYQYMQYQIVIN